MPQQSDRAGPATVELTAADAALVARARETAANAYAPYSGFHVGAALRAQDGRIFTAANMENASYGLSLCAETNAAAAAAVAGVRTIDAIAVVGYRNADVEAPVMAVPCGRCRQILSEFATAGTRVIVCDSAGTQTLDTTLSALLPHAFGPGALGQSDPVR